MLQDCSVFLYLPTNFVVILIIIRMYKKLLTLTLAALLYLCLASASNAQTRPPRTDTPPPRGGDPGSGGGGGGDIGRHVPDPASLIRGQFIPNGNPTNKGLEIILYEENFAQGDIIDNGDIVLPYNATAKGRFRYSEGDLFLHLIVHGNDGLEYENTKAPANDETRSLKISGMFAGRLITFYDNPSAQTDDDWIEILVKKAIPPTDFYQINSYQKSFEDEYVKVTYHEHNGLDGKVSYINVDKN